MLAGLARAHPAETAPGTGPVAIHDLLRLYARRLSDADDREQARDRLLGYYLTTADAADDHLRALPGTAVPEQFTGRDNALDWLDAERASLVAAVSMAAGTGQDQAAVRLPVALAEYFDWQRRFDDWLATMAADPFGAQAISSGLPPCGQAPVVIFDDGGSVPPAGRSAEESLSVQQGPQPKGRPAAPARPSARPGCPVFGRRSPGR